MTSKNLALITLAAASLASGQLKLPKLSDVKDKLPQKQTATDQPANQPSTLPAGSTKGTYKGQGIELTLCEKTVDEGQFDTACATPARTFQFKGSVTNVFATMRFNPPLTNASPRFEVQVFKDGNLDDSRQFTFPLGGRTAAVEFTKLPGVYTVKIVDRYHKEEIAVTDQFVVAPRAAGSQSK